MIADEPADPLLGDGGTPAPAPADLWCRCACYTGSGGTLSPACRVDPGNQADCPAGGTGWDIFVPQSEGRSACNEYSSIEEDGRTVGGNGFANRGTREAPQWEPVSCTYSNCRGNEARLDLVVVPDANAGSVQLRSGAPFKVNGTGPLQGEGSLVNLDPTDTHIVTFGGTTWRATARPSGPAYEFVVTEYYATLTSAPQVEANDTIEFVLPRSTETSQASLLEMYFNPIIADAGAVDCNGVQNGVAVYDVCGLCGGDGTSCAGCMDPAAINYDPQANFDDGTCMVLGCTNVGAINYRSAANIDDGTCIVMGCTNLAAINYNSAANFDDGTCIVMS